MNDLTLKSLKLEGQLSKYTNVMRGYQYRYFVVNAEFGRLDYFVSKDVKHERPRGTIDLKGAIISPSEEDSTTFIIHAADNEIFKLRAQDAKERQHWVNVLRLVSQANERVTDTLIETSSGSEAPTKASLANSNNIINNNDTVQKYSNEKITTNELVKEIFFLVRENHQNFETILNTLPTKNAVPSKYDKDILVLKATARECVNYLTDCCNILRVNQKKKYPYVGLNFYSNGTDLVVQKQQKQATAAQQPNKLEMFLSKIQNENFLSTLFSSSSLSSSSGVPKEINHDDEVTDDEEDATAASDDDETAQKQFEENKSHILHLLPHLKNGMDLTKIAMPTFLLERRSFLEMFADFMAHPDLFIKISDEKTPEDRMLAVLDWYLSCFHQIKKGSSIPAKKPYNPVIGEVFHCSWKVKSPNSNSNLLNHSTSNSGSVGTATTAADAATVDNSNLITFTSEQVSHHPAVTAFYVECKSKRMRLNGTVRLKSKYMGISICIKLIGHLLLRLDKYNEEYVITLPNCYARAIVTKPWLELGDECRISCIQTGYSAKIDFQVQSFYGEKSNQINAQVRNKTDELICQVKGDWSGILEYEYFSTAAASRKSPRLVIDMSALHVIRKRVRPLDKQETCESRRVWQQVTECLRKLDMAGATTHKNHIEKQQRMREKQQMSSEVATVGPKYFQKVKLSTSSFSAKSQKQQPLQDEANTGGDSDLEFDWIHKKWNN